MSCEGAEDFLKTLMSSFFSAISHGRIHLNTTLWLIDLQLRCTHEIYRMKLWNLRWNLATKIEVCSLNPHCVVNSDLTIVSQVAFFSSQSYFPSLWSEQKRHQVSTSLSLKCLRTFFFLQLNCVESLYVWSDIKRKHTIFIVLRNLTWIMGRLRTTTWETILTVNHVHDFITTITVKWARKCAQIRYFPSYLHAIHHFEPSIWPIYALEIEFFFWNMTPLTSTHERSAAASISEASRRSQKRALNTA